MNPSRIARQAIGATRFAVGTGIDLAGRVAGSALRAGASLLPGSDRGPHREDDAAETSQPAPTPEQGPTPEPPTPEPPPGPAPDPSPGPRPAPRVEAANEGEEEDGATDDELLTPSGIPAADPAHNPDTTVADLHQPGTEPLVSGSTAKAARKEAARMQRASDPDKR